MWKPASGENLSKICLEPGPAKCAERLNGISTVSLFGLASSTHIGTTRIEFLYIFEFRWISLGFSMALKVSTDLNCVLRISSDVPWIPLGLLTFVGFSLDARWVFTGCSIDFI